MSFKCSACKLTSWDITHGKQAHTCVSINSPFLSLTVGLTAVVHETRVVSFGTCIYNPILCTHTYRHMFTRQKFHNLSQLSIGASVAL